ncbi:MAG: ferric reductase [Pseudomonadota bacterium]
MIETRKWLPWLALFLAMAVPVIAAAFSPYLAWRRPVYIIAGFAGIAGFTLMLAQPLLANGMMPGLTRFKSRQVHTWLGGLIVAGVIIHVIGLYITSAPDVVDALLFSSPTPFAPWGVGAMVAIFAAAGLLMLRNRIRPRHWRLAHTLLVTAAVIGTIVHVLLIEGTMEFFTKWLLSAAVLIALAIAVFQLQRRVRR